MADGDVSSPHVEVAAGSGKGPPARKHHARKGQAADKEKQVKTRLLVTGTELLKDRQVSEKCLQHLPSMSGISRSSTSLWRRAVYSCRRVTYRLHI